MKQLLRLLRENRRSTDIAIWTETRAPSVVVQGEPFPSLPGSFFSILSPGKETGEGRLARYVSRTEPFDLFVVGSDALIINVKKKTGF